MGADAKTLEQLRLTFPTWMRHKPSLKKHPLVVFYDRTQISIEEVSGVVQEHPDVEFFPWPLPEFGPYPGDGSSKWNSPQRAKMLSGFVHVPAMRVRTKYWLKIDTDVVAEGLDPWDYMVFELAGCTEPAILAPSWGYTKPADQMHQLDVWVDRNCEYLGPLRSHSPLNIVPSLGSSLVRHQRIASWCAFFETAFTRQCSEWANATCELGQLPVPSQDGYLWYCAERTRRMIIKVDMKSLGWKLFSSTRKLKEGRTSD